MECSPGGGCFQLTEPRQPVKTPFSIFSLGLCAIAKLKGHNPFPSAGSGAELRPGKKGQPAECEDVHKGCVRNVRGHEGIQHAGLGSRPATEAAADRHG